MPNLGRMNLQGLTPGQLTAFYRHLLTSGRRDGKGGLAPKDREEHPRNPAPGTCRRNALGLRRPQRR